MKSLRVDTVSAANGSVKTDNAFLCSVNVITEENEEANLCFEIDTGSDVTTITSSDMQKNFSSPLIRSAFGLIFGLFFGFVVSLIGGLIIKRSRPE